LALIGRAAVGAPSTRSTKSSWHAVPAPCSAAVITTECTSCGGTRMASSNGAHRGSDPAAPPSVTVSADARIPGPFTDSSASSAFPWSPSTLSQPVSRTSRPRANSAGIITMIGCAGAPALESDMAMRRLRRPPWRTTLSRAKLAAGPLAYADQPKLAPGPLWTRDTRSLEVEVEGLLRGGQSGTGGHGEHAPEGTGQHMATGFHPHGRPDRGSQVERSRGSHRPTRCM